MKKRSKRLLALLLPTLVISLLPVNTTSAQPGDADTVVMTVNDDKITKGDIWRRTRLMFGAELAKVEGEEKKDLEKQLVPRIQEELIARSLLLREANKNKIEITNDELNEALNRIKQTAPEAADFGKFLEQMHLDEEGYRKGLRTEMKITKLVAKMTEALEPPSDEEVRKFYDDNPKMFEQGESAKARHILIKAGANESDDDRNSKRAQLEKIRQELLDGKDFAEMAGKHSDCPSKEQGGDLGQFGKGMMVAPFEKAAFSQEVGKVGEIVETDFGFHVILVEKRSESGVAPFEQVKGQIAGHLGEDRRSLVVKDTVEKLRKEARIVPAKPADAVDL